MRLLQVLDTTEYAALVDLVGEALFLRAMDERKRYSRHPSQYAFATWSATDEFEERLRNLWRDYARRVLGGDVAPGDE